MRVAKNEANENVVNVCGSVIKMLRSHKAEQSKGVFPAAKNRAAQRAQLLETLISRIESTVQTVLHEEISWDVLSEAAVGASTVVLDGQSDVESVTHRSDSVVTEQLDASENPVLRSEKKSRTRKKAELSPAGKLNTIPLWSHDEERSLQSDVLLMVRKLLIESINLSKEIAGDEAVNLLEDVLHKAIAKVNAFLVMETTQEIAAHIKHAEAIEKTQKSARIARISEEAILNPLAAVKKCIANGKNPEEAMNSVLGMLAKQFNPVVSDLTEAQKNFQAALEKEFVRRRLAIGVAIPYLIALSPIGSKYEELLVLQARAHAAHNAQTTQPLRDMVQKLGEIVEICMRNENDALKDLHQLFILKDVNTLDQLLKTLRRNQLLVVSRESALRDEAGVTNDVLSVAAKKLMQMNIAVQENMSQLADMLELSPSVSEPADAGLLAPSIGGGKQDSIVATSAVGDAVTRPLQALHFMLQSSSMIVQLMQEIHVHHQGLLVHAQAPELQDNFEALAKIAEDIQLDFKLMDVLVKHLRDQHEKMHQALGYLAMTVKREANEKSHAVVAQLKVQLIEISKIAIQWKDQFSHTQNHLASALERLSEVLDPEVVESLKKTSPQAVAERELKKNLAAKIHEALAFIGQERAKLSTPSLIDDVKIYAQDEQSLSLEFLVRLANKLQTQNVQYQTVVYLIKLLKESNHFSLQMQCKLLRRENYSVLVDLQKFLSVTGMRLSTVQLATVWDFLQDQVDFSLLENLHARFAFTAKEFVKLVIHFAKTWDTALPMLEAVFDNDLASKALLMNAVIAAGRQESLVEQLFEILETIKTHAPADQRESFLTSFFENMPFLIFKIQTSVAGRFAEELITRLESMESVPLKPGLEDWLYVIKRTAQYDERNLTYETVLKKWAENPSHQHYFDDESKAILAAHDVARFAGATHDNARRLGVVEQLEGEPLIVSDAHLADDQKPALSRVAQVPARSSDRDPLMQMNPQERLVFGWMGAALRNYTVCVHEGRMVTILPKTGAEPVAMDQMFVAVVHALRDKAQRKIELEKTLSTKLVALNEAQRNEVSAILADPTETSAEDVVNEVTALHTEIQRLSGETQVQADTALRSAYSTRASLPLFTVTVNPVATTVLDTVLGL